MTPEMVPETLSTIELLDLAHDAFDGLLTHGSVFEEFCFGCFGSVTELQKKIKDHLDESNAPDDLHNMTL